MQFSITTLAAIAATLISTGNAHMLMKTPKPYTSPVLDNGPLDPSGSNFPCKAPAGATYSGAATQMPIGSTQTLSFTGSAVHGGGSCQVAVTYTNPPPKDVSQWQVIYSIEGGCPAKNTAGNLPEDPNGNGAGSYPFKIPAGLKTGKATLAWTWFNKVGNREMYMNCAPIEITSGTSKRDLENMSLEEREVYDNATMLAERDASFPPLFTANIGNGCSTASSTDLQFPNPGSAVDKFGSGQLTPPVGTCATGGSSSPPTGGNPPAGSPSSAPASSPTPSKVPGGVFASQPATTMATSVTTPASAPSSSPAVVVSPPASTPSSVVAPPPSTGAAGAQTPGSACASEGMWNCLPEGKSFQQCGSGMWSAVIQMAMGTSCKPGQAMTLSMGTKHRRHARHANHRLA